MITTELAEAFILNAETKSKKSNRSWRTQEERRTEAEAALLKSAAELFAKQGITSTSLAAICENAGYSHGLVNHHFGSKAALVERLAKVSQENFMERVNPREAETGLEAILSVADNYISNFFRPDNVFSRCFIVMWGAAFVADRDKTFEIADERSRSIVAAYVEDGKKDGSISKKVDGEAFAIVLLAIIRGIAAQILVSPSRFDLDREKNETRRIIQLALT